MPDKLRQHEIAIQVETDFGGLYEAIVQVSTNLPTDRVCIDKGMRAWVDSIRRFYQANNIKIVAISKSESTMTDFPLSANVPLDIDLNEPSGYADLPLRH